MDQEGFYRRQNRLDADELQELTLAVLREAPERISPKAQEYISPSNEQLKHKSRNINSDLLEELNQKMLAEKEPLPSQVNPLSNQYTKKKVPELPLNRLKSSGVSSKGGPDLSSFRSFKSFEEPTIPVDQVQSCDDPLFLLGQVEKFCSSVNYVDLLKEVTGQLANIFEE